MIIDKLKRYLAVYFGKLFSKKEAPSPMVADSYHNTLARQLRKHFGNDCQKDERMRGFLLAVSETYNHYEEDRKLIERSLGLSSQELNDSNTQLKSKLAMLDERSKELEKMNKYMIGREIRMAELKRELRQCEELLKESNIDLPQKINQSPEM